jgi:hypothetical protein
VATNTHRAGAQQSRIMMRWLGCQVGALDRCSGADSLTWMTCHIVTLPSRQAHPLSPHTVLLSTT